MAISIDTEDMDIETLLGILERISPREKFTILHDEAGWSFIYGKPTHEFVDLQDNSRKYPTVQDAIVFAIEHKELLVR